MKYVSYLLLCILCLSCGTDSVNLTQKMTTISKHGELNNSLIGKYDMSIIKLETNKNCLLKRISSVDSIDGNILVLDSRSLYFFNENGKFIRRLKNGKGPGEILQGVNMSVDRDSKKVYVIDGGGYLKVYTSQGEFIRQYKIDIGMTGAYPLDEESALLHVARANPRQKYLLYKYDLKKSKIIDEYVNSESQLLKDIPMITYRNFVKTDSCIYYYTPLGRTVYMYKDNLLADLYNFNFEEREVPEGYTKKFKRPSQFIKSCQKEGYVDYLRFFFPFENFSLVGLNIDEFNCGVIPHTDKSKVYPASMSTIFELPDLPSFAAPINVINSDIWFSLDVSDLFQSSFTETNMKYFLGDEHMKISNTDNPILVILKKKIE